MKYVFRLSARVKQKLSIAGRAHESKQSGIVRDAIAGFLTKKKQSLADRPKLAGTEYKQVCVDVDDAQIEAIKAAYPNVSVSVVIQAAVISELRKARYRIAGLTSFTDSRDEETDPDADEHPDHNTGPVEGRRRKT
ncbi:hypothetical protein [Burkholderia vietnamiensis]|uniref:hypothetical protein n=1 Tax=Burkholderia vietnamiensis TaxID=60552 RepID=UPI001594505C|nr:hypothetical protein [Burkholderia vietnamiensis]MCA8270398.1 hypothetical protein [Burkholderia vietnamiensis]